MYLLLLPTRALPRLPGLLLFCLTLFLAAPATSQDPEPRTPLNSTTDAARQAESSAQRAEAAARAAQQHAQEAERAKADVDQAGAAAVASVRTVSSEMLDRAQWLEKISSHTVELFSAAATILGIIGVIGVTTSLSKIRQSQRSAAMAATQIDNLKHGLEEHHLFLNTLENQVIGALDEIRQKLQADLTPATGLIGVDLPAPIPQRSYDDDALLVFADRLHLTGKDVTPQRLSEFLIMTGNYWRRTKEYARAVERMKRAIELDPTSSAAHKGYGRALWNRVAEECAKANLLTALPQHQPDLDAAIAAFGKARQILAQNQQHDEEIQFDLATIARLKGDIPGAVKEYREGAKLSKALARHENREPDWDFDFGLACLFAVSGNYQEALDQLKTLLRKTESWSQERRRVEPRDYELWTRSDPDFAAMFRAPEWKERLETLLAKSEPLPAEDKKTT